jgi:hypothetical protein
VSERIPFKEALMGEIWNPRADVDWTGDMVGYKVEATDGSIGKIDEAPHEAGSSYIVVDTGPWIFGKKVLLPAGVITSVDHDEEAVWVSRSKDEIKDAPEFDESMERTESARQPYGDYYDRF